MKYNFWVFIWDTTEGFYALTGLDLAWPIQKIWPNFSPWLFGKMIGVKGKRVDSKGESLK